MAENSAIGWTDHTFSPWIGCDEVSDACDFCYARVLSERRGWAKWGPKEPRHRTAASTWKNPIALNRRAAQQGIKERIFPSLCDPFDNKVPREWRADFYDLINATPNLIWLLLTKRPQNIFDMWPGRGDAPHFDNVWLGTTAENQTEYDRRWKHLQRIPAVNHFVSYEPALGPLRIHELPAPDWVIAGGETGKDSERRPCNMQWFEDLRADCKSVGAAYFFKQDTARVPGQRGRASDALWACKQFPEAAP